MSTERARPREEYAKRVRPAPMPPPPASQAAHRAIALSYSRLAAAACSWYGRLASSSSARHNPPTLAVISGLDDSGLSSFSWAKGRGRIASGHRATGLRGRQGPTFLYLSRKNNM